ncbi:MAG: peptide chain release factor N(5)-glutamine methyltransferase [Phototrophicales bacterium]|nr:MAG: peptide chain release factor N(5)-glutamine methyltransferase [Phototrophicales bacterium]RMG72351.1 MAG: peptide chain release factor N(5)-glutamine methyltransferase [Chloroflexota bacterium]
MMTIRQALINAKARISAVSSSPGLDAQLLLAEVIGESRAHVIAHPERQLTPEQVAQYDAWITRRADAEPVAYILGRKAFYDREFLVTPAVLIPRPETEHLLEAALEFAADRPCVAVDVGTGSGALAVTFAANCPQATVYATDISHPALEIARQNAEVHHVNVTFLQGDLLMPLIERQIALDLLMANLPYIASDDVPQLLVSRHEPILALDGGVEGLDLIRRILEQSRHILKPGALILLEIGADQGEAVTQLAQQMLSPQQVSLMKDYAGHDRVVKITINNA